MYTYLSRYLSTFIIITAWSDRNLSLAQPSARPTGWYWQIIPTIAEQARRDLIVGCYPHVGLANLQAFGEVLGGVAAAAVRQKSSSLLSSFFSMLIVALVMTTVMIS